MKNRTELVKHFQELGFKIGAEVGVCKGKFSKKICENMTSLEKMYGIDNWSNTSGSHRERNHRDSAYKQTLENLKPFIESGLYIIIRKTSMEALADIADESLDFVYIDADHTYEGVNEDIRGWAPKVKKGGIVSGHDYYEFKSGNGGIIPAVDEYVFENEYNLQLTDWDKDNTEGDERQPSWYFVKE